MAIASPNKSVHKDDYHQVNVVSNVNIGAGANITTSNSYTNSTMAVIRTQGNDAGIVNFTINGGTNNGIANWGSIRNYAPGYYGASRGGSITVNSGTIEGYTGLLLRSGNATVTGGTIEGEGPAPGSGQQAVISSSDVGNAGGITLSGSNHRYGNISVNITGGTIISDNYSAINTYQSQETTQNSYPILNSSDFKVSGATLSGATVPILRTGTAEYSNASTQFTQWAQPTTVFKLSKKNLSSSDVSTISSFYQDGQTLYKVGDSYTASINTAQNISKQENAPVVVVGGSGQTNTSFDNLPQGKMLEASLTTSRTLSYFNINSSVLGNAGSGDQPEQVGSMDMSIIGTNATGYSTSNLNPEARPIS